jgi:WD40 repeat protein
VGAAIGESTVVTRSKDGLTRIWSDEGRLLETLTGDEDGGALRPGLPVGGFNAAGGSLRIIDGRGRLVARLRPEEGDSFKACAVSRDGSAIVTGTALGRFQVWNSDGAARLDLGGPPDPAPVGRPQRRGHMRWTRGTGRVDCAVNAAGDVFVTSFEGRPTRIWGADGALLRTLPGTAGHIGCGISDAGDRVMTVGRAGPVRIWDADGACLLELHPGDGSRVWLDADSQTLQFEGPAWPELRLVDSSGREPNRLGSTIAEWGPGAHERLANAAEWRFAPPDHAEADAAPAAAARSSR